MTLLEDLCLTSANSVLARSLHYLESSLAGVAVPLFLNLCHSFPAAAKLRGAALADRGRPEQTTVAIDNKGLVSLTETFSIWSPNGA